MPQRWPRSWLASRLLALLLFLALAATFSLVVPVLDALWGAAQPTIAGDDARSPAVEPSIRLSLMAAVEEAVNNRGPGDGVTHGEAVALSAAPTGSRVMAILPECGAAEAARFRDAHSRLLALHRAAGVQADDWTGHHPVCGVQRVFNLTGLYLCAALEAGTAAAAAPVFAVANPLTLRIVAIRVQAVALSFTRCPDIFFAVRIVGPSIVPAREIVAVGVGGAAATGDVVCEWRATVVPEDAGAYELQAHAVWIDGLGPEASPKRAPVTLRKMHSKFGRKPHQRYVFNGPCEAQAAIPGTPVAIKVVERRGPEAPPPPPPPAPPPRCTRGDHPGRWVRRDNTRPCETEAAPLCEGDASLLNDAKPFNRDYVWAPLECRYRFWRFGDGPGAQCVRRRGQLLLMGDSTAREYAQSLRLFDLRRTGLQPTYANWRIEHAWFSRRVVQDSLSRLRRELAAADPVVLCVNLGPLHLIGGINETEWRFYVDEWARIMGGGGGGASEAAAAGASRTREGGSDDQLLHSQFPRIERRILLLPSVIHYATSDMTEQRMVRWAAYARAKLEPLRFEILDAHAVTAGRIETSWDGVHHAAERGKAQMKHARPPRGAGLFRWNGGVSVALTTILLNMLCNRGTP